MTPGNVVNADCTVGLLVTAAAAAYKIKKDDIIDPTYNESYRKALVDIAEHGYAITESITPTQSKGSGKTPLAALCLTPQDPKAPIIVSFRGTKTMGDVASDLRLGFAGVVDKKFRDAAFAFYQKVRAEHPGREIILTGHSLGGHLAHYVGAKAYNTDPTLSANPLVQVRTFNPAPIKTKHSSIFASRPGLLSQFVNYRLSSDVVSRIPLQKYLGNTFVFPCDKGRLVSHPMTAVAEFLPAAILNQSVGTSSRASTKQNILIEMVNGVASSYQCRVQGQYFSRFRAGAKNLAAMQQDLPAVLELIKNHDYDKAISKLAAIKEKMKGGVSTNIIDVLMKSTDAVKKSQLMASSDEVSLAASGTVSSAHMVSDKSTRVTMQQEFRTQLQEMRVQADKKEDDSIDKPLEETGTPSLTGS